MEGNNYENVLKSGDFIGIPYNVKDLMKISNFCFINYQPTDKDKIKCMCGKKIKNKKINKQEHCNSNAHTAYLYKWISEKEELYIMSEGKNKEYFDLIIIDSINGD